MDGFEKKSIVVSRGYTYTYYVYTPPTTENAGVPTLFFQHGWPDDAHMWGDVVAKLPQYRIIAPDLLGYAGTSKPTDPAEYEYTKTTKDLTEILDAEGVDKVISIGHDWGSAVAQRLYLHHPERVAGLIILNVAYQLPAEQPFELERMLDFTEKLFGRPLHAYWELFTAEDGAALLRDKADRLYMGLHGGPPGMMARLFCTRGGMRAWLEGDEVVEIHDYAKDPEKQRAFVERMCRDGFEGPQCYYHAARYNYHLANDQAIPKERLVIKVPLLYFTCTGDAVCLPVPMKKCEELGLLPDYEMVTLECGHWSPLEKPNEIASGIDSFLKRKFPQA